MKEGIVYMTGGSPQSVALAHELAKQFDLRAIVVEEKKKSGSQVSAISIMRKLLGTALVEKLLIYRKKEMERKVLLTELHLRDKAQHALTKHLSTYNTTTWPHVPVIRSANINSEETASSIGAFDPVLIVVWGTGIIRKNIIDIPRIGVVNAHTSILPHYKGSFVEFWQSLHGAYDKAGVTFHFINEKVDEGDIIQAYVYSGENPVDPFILRNANVISIITNYPVVIRSILDGTHVRIRQTRDATKAYLFRHITIEKKKELFRKLGL